VRAERLILGAALAAAALVTLAARAEDPPPVVLCDFEKGEPVDGWNIKTLTVAEVETPTGRGLKLVGAADADAKYVGSISHACDVHDWRTARAFAMRARVDAKQPVEMRVIALRDPGPGALLRRFTLPPGDWRDVVLELRDFRDDGSDQAGSFASVGRIVLRWDEGAGEVTIDDLRLLPGDRGALSCTATPEQLSQLAFGAAKARTLESDHFVLIDDVLALSDADAMKLLARLEEGLKVLSERYGLRGELGDKVPFFLFATRDEYAEFVPRLGEHFGATVTPPKADGYSIFGMGMGWFDAKQGWNRPVFVHEGLHGAIHRLLGVANNSNWVQEGLASAVQVRLHPSSVDRKKLADSFAKRGGWLIPWAQCFAEPGALLSRYPQYLSVMDFLADQHAADLPKVWDAIRALREPMHKAAPAAIATALGTDAAKLEEEWFAWGANYYGGN
jgi:hypothetical protein